MKVSKITTVLSLIAGGILVSGCATNIARPSAPPSATTTRLGTFDTVRYENIEISPDFATATANQRAANKINQELIAGLQNVFPGMIVVAENSMADSSEKALIIRPLVKEIKFIGGAARFWVGAMAGSSAVLMQVDFVDSESGEIIGNPEFYRSASAFGGGMSVGASDNVMLTAIAQDIITYTVSNR